MRHLHSTKLQHLRKSTVKQTASVRKYANCAVGLCIRNAGVVGSSPIRGTRFHYIFPEMQTIRSQHYATFGGTNHDFHTL